MGRMVKTQLAGGEILISHLLAEMQTMAFFNGVTKSLEEG